MNRLVIIVSFIFVACSNSGSVPEAVLAPKKMEAVLYDVIRADEMVDFKSMMDSSYRPLAKRTGFYDTIFSIHATTKEVFKKSLAFYKTRPDLLKSILENLQKRVDTASQKKVDTTHKKLLP